MIQTTLKQLNPLLVDMIPHGSINALAEKHGLSRQTISAILRGDEKYSEDTITRVMKSALLMITQDSTEKINYVKRLEEVFAV